MTDDTFRPLAGVTVVDLARYLPGPLCTRLLADLGASIVKVESTSGDPMRGHGWFAALNEGKRVVQLDLRSAEGRSRLDALLAAADVCVESFRPSTARSLGVDGVTLRGRYPWLVHCSIRGYDAPDAERAGHDLNYQAAIGLVTEVAPPRFLLADITGAMNAAVQILAALVGRAATRSGAAVTVSLAGAARLWALLRPPLTLSGVFACYNVYETADGKRLALGALETKFWERFCGGIGRPDLIPLQFAPPAAQGSLVSELKTLFRTQPRDYWLRRFAGVDCCLSAVELPPEPPC